MSVLSSQREAGASTSVRARTIGPMATLLVVLASVVAGAAAIRSTWSPCGLSMLSTHHADRRAGPQPPLRLHGRLVRPRRHPRRRHARARRRGAGRRRRRPRPQPGGRPRRHRRARRGHPGVRPQPRRVPAAVAHPPGERGVARPVPQLGVRRRLRLADRRRAGHLRHHRRRVPDDRDGGAHRRSARRVRADDRVRLRARPGGAARPHASPPPSGCSRCTAGSPSSCPPPSAPSCSCRPPCSPIAAGAAWGPAARRIAARRRRPRSPRLRPAAAARPATRTRRRRQRPDRPGRMHLAEVDVRLPHTGSGPRIRNRTRVQLRSAGGSSSSRSSSVTSRYHMSAQSTQR